jgi:hypothetical protein
MPEVLNREHERSRLMIDNKYAISIIRTQHLMIKAGTYISDII